MRDFVVITLDSISVKQNIIFDELIPAKQLQVMGYVMIVGILA